MENTITPAIQNVQCPACYNNSTTEDAFCNNCSYPFKGTEQEQKNFMTQLAVNEIDLADYNAKIKKGGTSLYYVAGAFAIGTLLEIAREPDHSQIVASLIGGLIICGIFVFLAGWSRRKPFAAMISGACLFGVIVLIAAISNPLTIFSGIILKIFVVGCLVNGIRAAMDAEKLKKETHLN